MTRLDRRLHCCLCRRRIPVGGDVCVLDGEWRRRHPRMKGSLACHRCITRGEGWRCQPDLAPLPGGHVPAPGVGELCDSMDHVLCIGTQAGVARLYPDAVREQMEIDARLGLTGVGRRPGRSVGP